MEFPHLGQHCHEISCNTLDFLPVKCDGCSNIFCNKHFSYSQHSCTNAYSRDVQVPVCPLCNNPVPSKRGEQPDIAVGEHIDRDCQADPAVTKRKVYTNKCFVKGCKQKEIIKIKCDKCCKDYCLKHRHPDDHKCSEMRVTPAQAAGAAALARAKTTGVKSKITDWFSNQSCSSSVARKPAASSLPEVSVSSIQGRMSEDEALALALHKSMNETSPRSVQEENDRLLALSLANGDNQNRPSFNTQRNNNNRNCSLS